MKNTYDLQAQYVLQQGYAIWVVGNVPQLGEWQLEKAQRLQWTQGNSWRKSFTFTSNPLQVEFKYVKANYQLPTKGAIWQVGSNRTLADKRNVEFDPNRGKDNVILNYNGKPNLVRVYFSRDTLKSATSTGGALALTSALAAVAGPVGAITGAIISVVVAFGVNIIFEKCGPLGVSFTVNLVQTIIETNVVGGPIKYIQDLTGHHYEAISDFEAF